ncbi:MAG: patatin-like phospholipase family protein [Curvibacter sp.]|nr:patatin-like phospholipase family protein [Curvibacter sp.]
MKNRLTAAQKQQLFGAKPRTPQRVLALGGGGPAVGISVGFLLALDAWNNGPEVQREPFRKIDFPVWVAGCVGGWLTCLYHLGKGHNKAEQAQEMVRGFFRDDRMYDLFPAPMTFTPDVPEMLLAALKFMVTPSTYQNLVVPQEILKAYQDLANFYLTPSRWNPGDLAYTLLNSVFAPNPASRLIMGLLYKTEINGLNKLWFGPDYSLLKAFDLNLLKGPGTPDLYLNSYNLTQHRLDLYSNHVKGKKGVRPLDMPTLCASSALPYILQPVELGQDKELHMEGALIDSFNLSAVQELHDDFNEIWISRIVDHSQVKPPKNLLDALNNLIMLYAGTTSKHDIDLFVDRHHMEELSYALHQARHGGDPRHEPHLIEVIQLPVWSGTNYHWTQSNFNDSIAASQAACDKVIRDYAKGLRKNGAGKTALRTPDHTRL